MRNNKRKEKFILIISIILLAIILFYLFAFTLKIPNRIYGIFNPPREISEVDKYVFSVDEEFYYDKAYVLYWDVHKNVMYIDRDITDKKRINDIYNLSKEIKVKQKFYNDTPLNYYQVQNIMYNDGFCYIEFRKEGGKETHFCIVGKRFFDNGELSSFDEFKREIAECELFDYLDTFAVEYNREECIY